MKKLLLCLAIIGLSAIRSNAQGVIPGSATPYETWSQMWNTSSTYFGTVPTQGSNLIGKQLDTVTTSAAINLATTKFIAGRIGKVNLDTVIYDALPGGQGGSITFYCYTAKASGTVPHVLIQLQVSPDGLSWSNISGDSVTINPSSTSFIASGSANFTITAKNGRYYQYAISTTTANAAVYCGYYYTRPYLYQISGK